MIRTCELRVTMRWLGPAAAHGADHRQPDHAHHQRLGGAQPAVESGQGPSRAAGRVAVVAARRGIARVVRTASSWRGLTRLHARRGPARIADAVADAVL